MTFLHRTAAIARRGLRGSVAAEWGRVGHSSRQDVSVAQQRLNLQLTCSQTPIAPVWYMCRLDDRTISHAGRPRVISAVEGESECDSSNGSLTLHATVRVGRFLGRVRMSLGQGMRQFCSHLAERGVSPFHNSCCYSLASLPNAIHMSLSPERAKIANDVKIRDCPSASLSFCRSIRLSIPLRQHGP